jgi:hypothetical protein
LLEHFFDQQAVFVLVSGGVSFVIAALLMMRVDVPDE